METNNSPAVNIAERHKNINTDIKVDMYVL